jgi:hypothetical protein
MAWIDIPLSHINFGLFEANPASATVSVAASDLLLFRYKELSKDTLIVDFKISKIFFNPRNTVASGITMELKIPYERRQPELVFRYRTDLFERLRHRHRSGQRQSRPGLRGRAQRSQPQDRPHGSRHPERQHEFEQHWRVRHVRADHVRSHVEGQTRGRRTDDRISALVPDYSARSAIIGSTAVARRAGIQRAISATPSRITVVAANTAGSRELTL